MHRLGLIVLLPLVVACAKKEASPSNATPATAPTPPPSGGSASALDQARGQASLGPSAQTNAFDEPPEKGGGPSDRTAAPGGSATVAQGSASTGASTGGAGPGAHIAAIVDGSGKAVPAALEAAIRDKEKVVQFCYKDSTSAIADGTMEVTLVIAKDGVVKDVTTTATKPSFEICVQLGFKGAKLVKPPAGPYKVKITVSLSRT